MAENLRGFLHISEAAEYLGASPNTLRNWKTTGNGYGEEVKKEAEGAAIRREARPSQAGIG